MKEAQNVHTMFQDVASVHTTKAFSDKLNLGRMLSASLHTSYVCVIGRVPNKYQISVFIFWITLTSDITTHAKLRPNITTILARFHFMSKHVLSSKIYSRIRF